MGDELLERYALLCDREPDGEALTRMEQTRGGYYRTRSIRSGAMLEIEAYPMLPQAEARKVRKAQPSSEAQKALNERNARLRFRRLAEINFRDYEDYFFTGTIEAGEGESLPKLERVQQLFALFVRRVNRARKKAGLENMKYLAVVEGYEEGSRQKKLHVHALLEGGLSADAMSAMWTAGVITKCARLIHGKLDELCGYITKDPRGRKRWMRSRGNLRESKVTYANRRLSARAAWRVADDVAGRSAALEKLYPGYRIEQVDGHEAVEVRTNPYIAGCYIYARMRKIETEAERKARDRRWRGRR